MQTAQEQEANGKRSRYQWYHLCGGKFVRAATDGSRVRRRVKPTAPPYWCHHEGKWRKVPFGGFAR
jgi:hypothetical protein